MGKPSSPGGGIIKQDRDTRANGGCEYQLLSHFQVLFGNTLPSFCSLFEFAVDVPLVASPSVPWLWLRESQENHSAGVFLAPAPCFGLELLKEALVLSVL